MDNRKRRYLGITLAAVIGLGLLVGVGEVRAGVNTEEDFTRRFLAAPAIAGLLLEVAGIDNRYGKGQDGGNFIRDIANAMGSGTDFNGVSKYDAKEYEARIVSFLNKRLEEEKDNRRVIPRIGTLDPVASKAEYHWNGGSSGILMITLVDLSGYPILPDDFPIVPPTSFIPEDEWLTHYCDYFRANLVSEDYSDDYFGRLCDFNWRALSHEGGGVYNKTISSPSVFYSPWAIGYCGVWEIGIGPGPEREDVYIIEDTVQIEFILEAYLPWSGTWDTSGRGTLDLTQDACNVTGSYSHNGNTGFIEGTLLNCDPVYREWSDTLHGTWNDYNSDCNGTFTFSGYPDYRVVIL